MQKLSRSQEGEVRHQRVRNDGVPCVGRGEGQILRGGEPECTVRHGTKESM